MKWTINKLRKVMINPFYCIQLDPELCLKHPAMVTEDEWIKSNVKLIKEIGEEKYFRMLIDVLKGGYLKSEGGR